MGVRLLAVGVASLAAIGLFAVMVQVSSPTRRVRVGPEHAPALVRALNQARDSSVFGPESDWIVTKVNSAHRAMVVEVEVRRLEDARAIAIQIMKPMRSRGYEEILVYVRVPGGDIDAATRRIQWTPNGGYVETVYGAPR